MKVLLETVIVVEKRENAHINFHSRLIISALIVWFVGKVWGRGGSKEGETERQYVSTFITKAAGSLSF